MDYSELEREDGEIFALLQKERKRLSETLELIPSENIASPAVLEALGSAFTNKYSEGYPGKRYYGGNQHIDEVELLAIKRAKELFGAEHVNVQPYSGSPANFAVYSALAGSGGKILGMRLDMGGHLTHGHKVSLTGKFFEAHQYGVDKDTGLIDYDEVLRMAEEFKPKIIVCGASAYSRVIDFKRFHDIAQQVGAISMADISHISGIIAAGLHPSPFPFIDVVTTTTHKTLRGPRAALIMCKEKYAKEIDSAVFPGLQGGPHNNTIAAIAVALKEASTPDFKQYIKHVLANAKALAKTLSSNGLKIITGGTDNHLMLIDLSSLGISGKQAELALDEAGITVNKNTIPFDPRKPSDPSGIRIGTPLVTTRGMKEKEMEIIGSLILKVLRNIESDDVKRDVRKQVLELCRRYPLV